MDYCTCNRCPCCGKLVAQPAQPFTPYYPVQPFTPWTPIPVPTATPPWVAHPTGGLLDTIITTSGTGGAE